MNEPAPAPGVDPTRASIARVYDYALGGKDNFAVDREMLKKLIAVSPETPLIARINKEFGKRAAEYIADQGVKQFVDLGSGIPTTPPSIHETVRGIEPGAKVVYVDNDPIVVAHSRVLRSVDRGTTTILADLRKPEAILDHSELLSHIDFDAPVAVTIFSVLQAVSDEDDPWGIVRTIRERMAPGSYLAISHASTRSDSADMEHVARVAEESGYPPLVFRTDEEIGRFFEGFDVVKPGIFDIRSWRPEEKGPKIGIKLVGGVGRKSG
ncbi:MAG: SAM-dependent methyltransferase [Stackebrandtia sp.]